MSKKFIFAKDPNETKYKFLYDIYKDIEEYNWNKKHKILLAFDDVIADMLSNKKLNSIVTESFVRGKKLNIFFFFLLLWHNPIFCCARSILN